MAPLISSVLDLMKARRPRQPCLVCGRPVGDDERPVRVRNDGRVHRGCATYSMRRRPEGAARLGNRRRR